MFITKVFREWADLYRYSGRFEKRDHLKGKSTLVKDIAREIPSKTILKYMNENDDGRDDIAERISNSFKTSWRLAHIALLLREEFELLSIVKRFREGEYSDEHLALELSQITTHLPKTINALLKGGVK